MSPEMRGPPPQSALWSSPNESIYKSPRYGVTRDQPSHPYVNHVARATNYSYPPLPYIDDALEGPVFDNCWPTDDLASHDTIASTATTLTCTAPPILVQHVGYDHTQYPHDKLNIQFSAAPLHHESASAKGFATDSISPRPTLIPEQNTQTLPDNKTNLKKMRHERELVFQQAATELKQARCNIGSSIPANKAWDDAWEILRETMTKM